MKKLIFAATLAAAMTGFCEVTSANVVGYQTIKIYPGNNMFTINFKNMADNEGYTLDQLFPGKTPGLTANTGSGTSDNVKTWDPSLDSGKGGYGQTYYLYARKKGDGSYDDDGVNFTWRISKNTASDLKVRSGTCFWFYHKADVGNEPIEFQVPGEVEFTQQGVNVTIVGDNSYNMIGAPFAADCDLNDLGIAYWKARFEAGDVVANTGSGTADYVKAWDPTLDSGKGGYGQTYYLYARKSGTVYADDGVNFTWRKSKNDIAPAGFIKMGTGCWYFCKGNGFTMTLPYPYDL